MTDITTAFSCAVKMHRQASFCRTSHKSFPQLSVGMQTRLSFFLIIRTKTEEIFSCAVKMLT